MLLAIDIGNTNIKIGVFDKDQLFKSWKMTSSEKRTSDEIVGQFKQIFYGADLDVNCIDGAIMSSVIPQLNFSMQRAIEYCFKVKVMVVNVKMDCGLKICYDNPEELGTDRILDCVAAEKYYGGPFILVDYGTATTYNCVDEKGVFVGGCICTGIKQKMISLSSATARLPEVELINVSKAIETSTVRGIQSGMLLSTVGETLYITNRMKKELGKDNVKIIATGGFSSLVAKNEGLFDVIDKELSLKGLNVIYQRIK